MSQDDAYKPHPPTPQRLRKRREEGKSPRASVVLMIVLCLGCAGLAPLFNRAPWMSYGQLLQMIAGGEIPRQHLKNVMAQITLICGVIAVFAIAAQRGFGPIVFKPDNLSFKFSRIDLFKNIKNKFGAQGLSDFAIKVVFFCLTSAAAYWYMARSDYFVHFYTSATRDMIASAIFALAGFCLIMAGLFMLYAVAEYVHKYLFFIKDNKMSHQELKEEIEGEEGKAEIKQERRRRAMELSKSIGLENVAQADVIMVNPTHYAVALKWDRGSGQVPVCVSRGCDEMAFAIRRLGREHDVPIYEDPPNTRRLYRTIRVGDPIEKEYFQCVAAAIAFADRMRKEVRVDGVTSS